MSKEIQEKIRKIGDVWNSYILKYRYCNGKTRFTEDIKTNYLGIIFGYFEDTLEIIYKKNSSKSHTKIFANHISLLQSIYVHQDLIEEMLFIFKLEINKGDLKNDENYNINREIRNELVGHPIRKDKYNKLTSSSLFGYDSDISKISYLRYHTENNHNFEHKTIDVSEIIDRHTLFLNTYLDKIYNRLKTILISFIKEIKKVEIHIINQDLPVLLKILNVSFESIFTQDYLYDSDSLLKIHNLKDTHIRYQNYIESFYKDLKQSLKETKEYATQLINWSYKDIKTKRQKTPKIEIKFVNYEDTHIDINEKKLIKKSYHYELGKLSDPNRRNSHDFDFFSSPLKSNYKENNMIINELKNMKTNLYNDFEYYCSHRLISKILKEDEYI